MVTIEGNPAPRSVVSGLRHYGPAAAFVAAALSLTLLLRGNSTGNTYYVSPTGSDSNPCSAALPCGPQPISRSRSRQLHHLVLPKLFPSSGPTSRSPKQTRRHATHQHHSCRTCSDRVVLLSLPAVWSAALITRQARNAIPSLFWIDNLNCATVLRVLHTVAVGIILESLVVDLYALVS